MKTRNLIGRVNQLTIFGEVEFIESNEYFVSLKGNVVTISGQFKVVDTNYIEQLMIEMSVNDYIRHSK